MKIAALGTGMVGRAIAAKLVALGHDVVVGTRDVEATLARAEPDAMGNLPYAEWQQDNAQVRLVAARRRRRAWRAVVNATSGQGSRAALEGAGAGNLSGKVILDLANRSISPRACRRPCRSRTRTASPSSFRPRFPTRASSRR